MMAHRFGSDEFSLEVEVVERFHDHAELSQIIAVFRGVGWSLGAAERSESVGVVAQRLSGFVAGASARHWGPFGQAMGPVDVAEHVSALAFGSGADAGFRHGEAAAALARYSLSACFDHNLGVAQAVAVRGRGTETLIWMLDDGGVHQEVVSADAFDHAISAFVEWSTTWIG